jgi:hypothetical protein
MAPGFIPVPGNIIGNLDGQIPAGRLPVKKEPGPYKEPVRVLYDFRFAHYLPVSAFFFPGSTG